MKALMFQGANQAEVVEAERPEIGPDEILVASRAVGVCHSDFDLLSGKYIIPISFPTIPGHEWSGEVAEVGREVTSYKPGDRVVGECVIGEDHFGFSISGAAAEYFKVRPEWLHKLPDELSYAYGALVEPFTVAYYAVQEARNVNASDLVAVLGAGPIGLCCLAAAKGHGADVVVIDPVAERRAIAESMGAMATLEPGEGLEERFAAVAGEPPQVIIEASGNPLAMASAVDLAGFRSRLVYVGIETGDSAPAFLGQIQSKELSIRGVIGSPNVWPAALRFLARGGIDLDAVITASFPLERATEALDAARRTDENVKVQMVSEGGQLMRAARYYGVKDIRVEEVPEPNGDLGPTQVLIAPRQVGICGTDLHEYVAGPIVTPSEPHPLTGAQLPQILGHELSADVVAVGAEVTNVVPGDRISVMPLVFCGKCYFCRRGLNHLCVEMGCFGLSWDWGGMAGLGVVESYQAWPLPDEVSYEQGALVEPGAVAEWGVKQAGVGPGDTVLVAGAGPIGALTVLAAQAAGAGAVYLSEPNARRAARAENLGAAAIFDPTATDVVGEIRERTEGLGVDVAIECAGNNAALRACLDAVRAHGTVAQVGLHVKDAAIDAMELSHRELTLVGTWCFSVHDWPRIIGLVASGAYPVERAVSDHATLDRVVEDGFEQLIDPAGDQIKILVETK